MKHSAYTVKHISVLLQRPNYNFWVNKVVSKEVRMWTSNNNLGGTGKSLFCNLYSSK